jgi:hypothetical protein
MLWGHSFSYLFAKRFTNSENRQLIKRTGGPYRTRTCNRPLRRRVLYPVELRGHLDIQISVCAGNYPCPRARSTAELLSEHLFQNIRRALRGIGADGRFFLGQVMENPVQRQRRGVGFDVAFDIGYERDRFVL